jgi:2-polyprenyl-6-hydroxyphenyl methylase / 3-demethylubiquinone-9 3-methyltransferase
MEVIEHVADPAACVKTCAGLLRPQGLIFIATINRTLKSFGLAIIGAEYILGWLPRGTHQWEKLIKPEELHEWLAATGLETLDETGVAYSPFTAEWRRARDMDVNYMLVAQKP